MSVAISSQVWVLLISSARAIFWCGQVETYMSLGAGGFPTNFETAFMDKLNETLPPNVKLQECCSS